MPGCGDTSARQKKSNRRGLRGIEAHASESQFCRSENGSELRGSAACRALPACVDGGNRIGVKRFGREADEFAAEDQCCIAARIGEMALGADAHEAAWQYMLRVAAQKLRPFSDSLTGRRPAAAAIAADRLPDKRSELK
jgi:hypothetical protein